MTEQFDIGQIVKSLYAEPLTHLMLGHRELFHSNLLAWFFENMKGESDLVFADLSLEVAKSNTVRKRRVAREENNFDLGLIGQIADLY
jgi:hypothetical protein